MWLRVPGKDRQRSSRAQGWSVLTCTAAAETPCSRRSRTARACASSLQVQPASQQSVSLPVHLLRPPECFSEPAASTHMVHALCMIGKACKA